MNDVELAVRRALHELADEGRPVPLGRRALTTVRRRRRRRTRVVSIAAAVALAAGAVPRLLGGDAPPADPPPDLAGRSVVAAYQTYAGVWVLDPATGRYRSTDLNVTAVSADLRFAAGTGPAGYVTTFPEPDPRIGILDTRTGGLAWLPMPHAVKDPVWSPAGHLLVARTDSPQPRAVLVDPVREKTTVVPLSVPDDHALLKLCWADAGHLAAVAAGRPGTGSAGSLRVLRLATDGQVVDELSVPDGWQVTCAGRQGRLLATRLAEHPPDAEIVPPEVAVVDLHAGTLSEPVRLPWAGAVKPVAWRSADTFVATSQRTVLVVDLVDGTVSEVSGVAAGHEPPYTIFLPGEGLSDHAAEVADASF